MRNPFKVYKELDVANANLQNMHIQLMELKSDLAQKALQIIDLNKKLGASDTELTKAEIKANAKVQEACKLLQLEHSKYRESVLEKEQLTDKKLEEMHSTCRQHKQELEECEGQVFHLAKALELQKSQHDVSIEALQTEVLRHRQEKKDLTFRVERLQQLLDDMSLYLMDPKDVDGRIFSKIAPLIDEEGYALLKEGKGRLKAKIIEPGRKHRVVYLEKAD